MEQKLQSNYLGNGKKYDGANGTDVVVSRGRAGEWMYDFEPMRCEAEKQQAAHPGAWVTFFCPLNGVTVAGFTGADGGPRIDLEMSPDAYLTKPVRIWYADSAEGAK